jgi:translation initiation factor RLI1
MPFNKDGKRTNSPMKYGEVKKPKMTDKKINLDYKRKQTREEIKEREERIQRRLREDARNKSSKKAQMYKPPMKHHGPYMMKPGSKEIDTPGAFRADSKAMMFKKNMPKMMVDTEKLSAGKKKLVEGVAKADMKPKKYHK